ncbi:hypothetical protein JCM14469_27790 [Desulfatiferula olefinivorans]
MDGAGRTIGVVGAARGDDGDLIGHGLLRMTVWGDRVRRTGLMSDNGCHYRPDVGKRKEGRGSAYKISTIILTIPLYIVLIRHVTISGRGAGHSGGRMPAGMDPIFNVMAKDKGTIC